MSPLGHGGARLGAGRKPHPELRVKRTVTLSAAADAVVYGQQQPGESYSTVLERLLLTHPPAIRTPFDDLVAALRPERQRVATLYRQLGWSRQQFERLIHTNRVRLAELGVRLHVATHDAGSGRREGYITVDGVRYSALSRDA